MHKKKNHKGGKPFSLRERSIVEVRWCRDSKSITAIAKELKRNKSSVSREIGGKPRKGCRAKRVFDQSRSAAGAVVTIVAISRLVEDLTGTILDGHRFEFSRGSASLIDTIIRVYCLLDRRPCAACGIGIGA